MSLKVYCRIKPPSSSLFSSKNNALHVKSHSFLFDHVFSESSSQKEIFFTAASPILSQTLRGESGLVILFGASESGKSYTLKGAEGKDKGLLFRSADYLLSEVQSLQSQGRNFELKISIFQIYQDIITDLAVFGSRGLTVYEKEDFVFIENLTEHRISNIEDFKSHIHHSFQIRKTITKPDPKLKLKSTFAVFFTLYEDSLFFSQFGLVELPGSENASNDQAVVKANSLSVEEKKSIARSFNALAAVLGKQDLFRESSLTLSCKGLLKGNIAVICTVTPATVQFKHTLASLKYCKRLKEGTADKPKGLQQEVKEELKKIRHELKEAKFVTQDWAESRQSALTRLENLIISNRSLLGSPQECEEFLIECGILQNQLQNLKQRNTRHEGRSVSPLNEEPNTDREGILRFKVVSLQAQNENQLRKIEEISSQVNSRDSEIRMLHSRIAELEKTSFNKDKIIQDLEVKLAEFSSKINEYKKKMKGFSSKSLAQQKNIREELLQDQIIDLEDRLSREKEENSLQLQKLKLNIQSKERIIQELQISSNKIINEKDMLIQELKIKVKNKGLALNDLEKQTINLSNTSSEAKFKMEVLSSSNKKLEEENSLIRKKLEDLSHRNSSIESKNLLLLQKNDQLEREISSALQEIDSRKYKTQQLSSTLKDMENTMSISGEEITRMKFELSQLRSENQLFRIEKDSLVQENSALKEENFAAKSELKQLSNNFEETNNFLREKESKLQGLSVDHPAVKQKKKKIKSLKDVILNLQQQLKDCQSLAEKEIKDVLDEKNLALAELEEMKSGQNHDLSMVESQVNAIEEQMFKLKEQNRELQNRENELVKELKHSENGKEKYKETILELKEKVKTLEGQLDEMDQFNREYIEKYRKDIKDMKIEEEKAVVLKSRIRAMHDVKNMILAHRAKSNN